MLMNFSSFSQISTIYAIASLNILANLSGSASASSSTLPSPISSARLNEHVALQHHKRRRFSFHGPILTLTLKDPFADDRIENLHSFSSAPTESKEESLSSSSGDDTSTSTSSRTKRHYFWSRRHNHAIYSNFLKLNSLAPTIFYSIRSTTKPLPNYLPWLQSTSISAGYKYDDVKNKPSFIEGEIKLRKMFGLSGVWGNGRRMAVEMDIGPSYMVKEKKGALLLRLGGVGGTLSGNGIDNEGYEYGCFGIARFVLNKGKKYLEHVRGSYKMNLPFNAVGSISITPSYDFERSEPACSILGKSSSGRTAAVLDLNWDNPTLSVIHALDQRNTISPEISLYDAKILYNWSVALESGAIKTRVDPCSAIQVTWTDQSSNGKWVTDFKLPLVGNPGPLAGDIRVRRQFVF